MDYRSCENKRSAPSPSTASRCPRRWRSPCSNSPAPEELSDNRQSPFLHFLNYWRWQLDLSRGLRFGRLPFPSMAYSVPSPVLRRMTRIQLLPPPAETRHLDLWYS